MTQPESPRRGRGKSFRLMQIWDSVGMLAIFLLIFAGASTLVDGFWSTRNLGGLLLSIATVGIVACTMLFCLASGDFDLSVGSVLAMGGVAAVVVNNATGSPALGVLAGVLAGGVVGLLNGVVIALIGVNALIATLATMQIARGLAYIIGSGESVAIRSESFRGNIFGFLGGSRQLGEFSLGHPVIIMLLCFVVFGVLLHRTVFGRNTLAIGGNAEAARLAGISVRRSKIIIFSVQGLVAALAGVILASRLQIGDPKAGVGLELQVISACVLGGVSLTGGRGTILAVIVGAMIMGTVQRAMDLEGIKAFYQYVVSGGILMAAVILDRIKYFRE